MKYSHRGYPGNFAAKVRYYQELGQEKAARSVNNNRAWLPRLVNPRVRMTCIARSAYLASAYKAAFGTEVLSFTQEQVNEMVGRTAVRHGMDGDWD